MARELAPVSTKVQPGASSNLISPWLAACAKCRPSRSAGVQPVRRPASLRGTEKLLTLARQGAVGHRAATASPRIFPIGNPIENVKGRQYCSFGSSTGRCRKSLLKGNSPGRFAPGGDPRIPHILDTPARRGGDQLQPTLPKRAAFMDEADIAVLAHMTFLATNRAELHSTNPIERLQGEIKRPIDVVGAILFKQNDEAAVQRARYMALETIVPLNDDPAVNLTAIEA